MYYAGAAAIPNELTYVVTSPGGAPLRWEDGSVMATNQVIPANTTFKGVLHPHDLVEVTSPPGYVGYVNVYETQQFGGPVPSVQGAYVGDGDGLGGWGPVIDQPQGCPPGYWWDPSRALCAPLVPPPPPAPVSSLHRAGAERRGHEGRGHEHGRGRRPGEQDNAGQTAGNVLMAIFNPIGAAIASAAKGGGGRGDEHRRRMEEHHRAEVRHRAGWWPGGREQEHHHHHHRSWWERFFTGQAAGTPGTPGGAPLPSPGRPTGSSVPAQPVPAGGAHHPAPASTAASHAGSAVEHAHAATASAAHPAARGTGAHEAARAAQTHATHAMEHARRAAASPTRHGAEHHARQAAHHARTAEHHAERAHGVLRGRGVPVHGRGYAPARGRAYAHPAWGRGWEGQPAWGYEGGYPAYEGGYPAYEGGYPAYEEGGFPGVEPRFHHHRAQCVLRDEDGVCLKERIHIPGGFIVFRLTRAGVERGRMLEVEEQGANDQYQATQGQPPPGPEAGPMPGSDEAPTSDQGAPDQGAPDQGAPDQGVPAPDQGSPDQAAALDPSVQGYFAGWDMIFTDHYGGLNPFSPAAWDSAYLYPTEIPYSEVVPPDYVGIQSGPAIVGIQSGPAIVGIQSGPAIVGVQSGPAIVGWDDGGDY